MASTRILLVVPQSDVRSTLSEWLGELGFEVDAAAPGADAVSAFQRQFYKLVIFGFDSDRPDILKTLGRMRKETGGRPTRAMAVTGASGTALVRLKSFSRYLGVTAFVHTPLDRQALIGSLLTVMELPEDGAAPLETARLETEETEQDRLLRLQFELYELSRQPAFARLGLSAGAAQVEIRRAYFELVAAYHNEAAKARCLQSRRSVERIHTVLSEAYLSARRASNSEQPSADETDSNADEAARDTSIQAVRRREVIESDESVERLLEAARLALVICDYERSARLLRRVLVMRPGQREARYYLMVALERITQRRHESEPAQAGL